MLSLVVVCGVDVMIKSLYVHTYSYSYIVLVLTNPCRSADKSVRARVDILVSGGINNLFFIIIND